MAVFTLLSRDQIRELCSELSAFIAYIEARKMAVPVAELLKQPQTPGILGESIALHLLVDGKVEAAGPIHGASLGRGPNSPDIIVQAPGRPLSVEVKSSRGNGWCSRGRGDLEADILMWVHFGSYFDAVPASTTYASGVDVSSASDPVADVIPTPTATEAKLIEVYVFPNPTRFRAQLEPDNDLRLAKLLSLYGQEEHQVLLVDPLVL